MDTALNGRQKKQNDSHRPLYTGEKNYGTYQRMPSQNIDRFYTYEVQNIFAMQTQRGLFNSQQPVWIIIEVRQNKHRKLNQQAFLQPLLWNPADR